MLGFPTIAGRRLTNGVTGVMLWAPTPYAEVHDIRIEDEK